MGPRKHENRTSPPPDPLKCHFDILTGSESKLNARGRNEHFPATQIFHGRSQI